MAVLADNTRAGGRRQLGRRAALGVRVGKLEDRRALPSNRVLENLADPNRVEVRRTVRIGVRHADNVDRRRPREQQPPGQSACERQSRDGSSSPKTTTPATERSAELSQ